MYLGGNFLFVRCLVSAFFIYADIIVLFICQIADNILYFILKLALCKEIIPIFFKDCSDFQAGSEIRSKGRYEGLDETAVCGLNCKHGIPIKFLNLKGGERYST